MKAVSFMITSNNKRYEIFARNIAIYNTEQFCTLPALLENSGDNT